MESTQSPEGAGEAARHVPAATTRAPKWGPARTRKFRQAAFVYLHVAILYEFATVAFWRQGAAPTSFGPVPLWLLAGGLMAALVVWALWSWQNAWFARIVWVIHGLRLPSLMERAFFPDVASDASSSFHIMAICVIIINLWMLARAGWDL